eukprot:1160452-Pelagomonas_calceolata.AAC.1
MCQPAHACTERAGLAGMLKHTSHHCTHVNTGARVRKRMSTCASKQAHAHAHKPSTARGMSVCTDHKAKLLRALVPGNQNRANRRGLDHRRCIYCPCPWLTNCDPLNNQQHRTRRAWMRRRMLRLCVQASSMQRETSVCMSGPSSLKACMLCHTCPRAPSVPAAFPLPL